MANLGGTFDPSTVPAGDNNFEVFAPGWYEMQIVESDVKATKDGTGKYVSLSWEILGPTSVGRRVFGNINIRNKSEKAQAIGERQLAEICYATGVGVIDSDTEELHYKPCLGLVAIEPAKDGYEAKNIVKRWKAIGLGEEPAPARPTSTSGSSAATSATRTTTAQSAQAAPASAARGSAAAGSRPWAKK